MFDPTRDALCPEPFQEVLETKDFGMGSSDTFYCWTRKAEKHQGYHGGLCYKIRQRPSHRDWWYCHECVGEYLVQKGLLW